MLAGAFPTKRRARGFTLVELMVVVVVVGIMLTVAVPAYTSIIARNRISAKLNEIVGAMQMARAEAVRRMVDVSVCAVESGAACGDGADGSWATGVAVIAEVDPGGSNGTQDANDVVVLRNDVHTATLVFRGLEGGAPPKSITYGPSGRTRLAPGARFDLIVCVGQSHGGMLTVDGTGRPRSRTLDDDELGDHCGDDA